MELLGFNTFGENLTPLMGANRTYRTATSNESVHQQKREAKIVPVHFRPGFRLEQITAHIDEVDQPDIREILHQGVFVSTEQHEAKSNAALLMNYAPGHRYSGRGGVLMYRDGDELKPVTLTRNTLLGKRKYLLDFKGTGTPDGRLVRTDEAVIGGLSGGAKEEFESLREAEKQHPLHKSGIIPLPVYYGVDQRGFGQVVRAIPTTVRASYRDNPTFDSHRALSHTQLAYGLGKELGRYLAFTPPRLATNLQTENAYLVTTDTGQEVIATDFNEIISLHEQVDPFFGLEVSFAIIQASTYEDPWSLVNATTGVVDGIEEVRPDIVLPQNEVVNWNSSTAVAEYLFDNFLAEEIIKNRLSRGLKIDAAYLQERFDPIMAREYKRNPRFAMPREMKRYFEEEERLFAYMSDDEAARDALIYVLVAKAKLKSAWDIFEITNENIKDYEALLPIPFYK